MQRDPFAVLHLDPAVDLETARSEYRALARRHHPDTAGAADKQAATRRMAELNWAIAELERDIEHWRLLSGARSAVSLAYATRQAATPVSVTPTLVLLDHENGFIAYITAAGPRVAARDVKLRYSSELIAVERLQLAGAGVANFRITLAPGVSVLSRAQIERVEVRAPGLRPVEVRVSVESFSAVAAPQPAQPAPALLPLAGLLAGAAAFAGALALQLLAL